jgi:ribosomal protein S18 acetylase RimI-like enzyme
MLMVMKVDESNKLRVIDALKLDVVRHAFAFYDLQHDPEHTTVYAAFDNEKLKGYILTYSALDWISVILECDEDLAEKLLTYAPENHFIMHTSPNLLSTIKNKFPIAKHYVEDWMIVDKGEAKLFKSGYVRKLSTKEDGSKLAELLSTREDRPTGTENKYHDWIGRMPMYGVFVNDKLVSYAGSFIQTPQIWLIGGVYTNPEHRNKGYATLATSAITEEALRNTEMAALFVRADNYPAIKAYERIGYKRIGLKLWVDVGTGLKP